MGGYAPSGHREHLPARAAGAHTSDHHFPWIGESGEHPFLLRPLGPVPPGRPRTGEFRERHAWEGSDVRVVVGVPLDFGTLPTAAGWAGSGVVVAGAATWGGGGRRGGLGRAPALPQAVRVMAATARTTAAMIFFMRCSVLRCMRTFIL